MMRDEAQCRCFVCMFFAVNRSFYAPMQRWHEVTVGNYCRDDNTTIPVHSNSVEEDGLRSYRGNEEYVNLEGWKPGG